MEYLQGKIELLCFHMIDMAFEHGSLTHEKVVNVSQQLDRYIVVYQKLKYKKLKLKR